MISICGGRQILPPTHARFRAGRAVPVAAAAPARVAPTVPHAAAFALAHERRPAARRLPRRVALAAARLGRHLAARRAGTAVAAENATIDVLGMKKEWEGEGEGREGEKNGPSVNHPEHCQTARRAGAEVAAEMNLYPTYNIYFCFLGPGEGEGTGRKGNMSQPSLNIANTRRTAIRLPRSAPDARGSRNGVY